MNAVQRMQSITNYLNPTDLDQNNGNQEINQQAELYGDKYNIKPDGVTRIWFTNPCGIGVNPNDIKSHDSFNFLRRKSKTDIFGLATKWFSYLLF